MAATISCFSGGVVFTSRFLAGSCTSAGAVGGGLFRTSLKCSAHLASCSASVVSIRPCLSAMGVSVDPRYLPLTSLVILYTRPCSPLVLLLPLQGLPCRPACWP